MRTALAIVVAALATSAFADESYPVDWKGTWQSSEGYANELSGTLAAKVIRREGDRWEAAFSAVPVKGLELKFPLQGERDGKLVIFNGEVSLGPRGKIAWTGFLHPEQFTGTFELVGGKIRGTFRMTPAEAPFVPPAGGAQEKNGAAGIAFFEKKIRPALIEHCYKCHSAETKKTRGYLAVDTRAGLLEGGDTGPAVVPGQPKKSLLLKALKHDGIKMPNESKKLADAVIEDFEAWILMGAPDPRDGKTVIKKGIDFTEARKHWAYQPVNATPPSKVDNADWPKSEIDRYVLARIESKKLSPAADAEPTKILRRLSFDLTGLPPTFDELAAFEKAAARNPQDAIEKTVDRLLASPRFGEHWARHWLDGVRFNASIESMHHYQMWVIEALNQDMPYDRFIQLQLAGDLLPETDVKNRDGSIIATQMLALNQREMDPIEGMVEVVSQQILGVSINCAKCHDHKFDAYSQTDYWALAGIFASSQITGGRGGGKKVTVSLPSNPSVQLTALAEGNVGDINLLVRGEKSNKGPVVPRRYPVVLAGEQQTPLKEITKQSGRLELARWVTDPAHPLTARVMVNRVWQRLFGQAIVSSPNDFGLQGQPPTHPELLDYLAGRFVKQGWSLKSSIREIVLSRTYRQSARTSPEILAADPENTLLTRRPHHRLQYEQIVDALNFAGGCLDLDSPWKSGAKGPVGGWRFDAGKAPGKGELDASYRALYHTDPVTRSLFDGPDPDLLTERRESSVTAPQMLFFLNNQRVQKIGEAAARRVEKLSGSLDPEAKAAVAYRLLLGRSPSLHEAADAAQFLQRHSLDRLCQTLLASSEFIYLD